MISGRSGIAEIQIVGDGDRLGADGGEIAPAFRDRLLAAFEGIGLDIARGHIGRSGERLAAVADPDDGGIAARHLRRVGQDQMVILLPHPAARAEIGRAHES